MDMTQHRITLPILSGGLRSCMEYFYFCKYNQQEEGGGGSLEKDEVQGCFDEGSEKSNKGKNK